MSSKNDVGRITRRQAMAVSLGAAGMAAVGGIPIAAGPRNRKPTVHRKGHQSMAETTWTLTDVAEGKYVDSIRLTPEVVGERRGAWSVVKRTLRGGLTDGVDVVEIDNGSFRFLVVPTRGMGIHEAWHGDLRLGWASPVRGPVHPKWVRLNDPSGLGWLDGFDELVVRCGLEYNGGPEFHPNGTLQYGLHGKVANTPAHKVEVSLDARTGRMAVTGVVDEGRLFGNKLRLVSTVSTQVGRLGMTITDTVVNMSAELGELALIYHTNFGPPLLEPGARIVLPFRKAAAYDQVALRDLGNWDRYGPERPGSAEVCVLFELAAATDGRTLVVLRNAAGDRGISYQFSKNELPWFTLWKNCQAAADGYVTGLEPGVNLPNTRSFEKSKGRIAVLLPGQSRRFQLALEVLPSAEAVAAAEKAVARLQQGATPTVLPQRMPDWSAG